MDSLDSPDSPDSPIPNNEYNTPPKAPRKRQIQHDEDEDEGERDEFFSSVAKRLNFSNYYQKRVEETQNEIYTLAANNLNADLYLYLDGVFNNNAYKLNPKDVFNYRNILKIVELNDLRIFELIYKTDFWILNKHYEDILLKVSFKTIKFLIEKQYIDFKHIAKYQDENPYTLLCKNITHNINYNVDIANVLIRQFQKTFFINLDELMVELVKYSITSHLYQYILTKVFYPDETNSPEFIELNSQVQMKRIILMMNSRFRVKFINYSKFLSLFDKRSGFSYAEMDDEVVDMIEKIINKVYDNINKDTVETLTVKYNQERAYSIISRAWMDCMYNPKWVYGRMRILKIAICDGGLDDLNDTVKSLIQKRENCTDGKTRHALWMKLLPLIQQTIPAPKL